MAAFKNMFSLISSRRIARALKRACPAFSELDFLRGLEKELAKRELKDRMVLLATRIEQCVPGDTEDLLRTLVWTLRDDHQDSELRGFLLWPFTHVVATRGLDHFEISMAALKEMTKKFTAEFALRPFLIEHRDRTLKQLLKWSRDPDEHVRRLTSEGTRPLLPWGQRLTEFRDDPTLAEPILNRLRKDPSESVRRSVANHLNDHAKSHPDWVLKTLRAWRAENPNHEGIAWIARHASRTLLKAGHTGALDLHGFGTAKELRVTCEKLSPKKVIMGGDLSYRIRIENRSKQPVKVLFDYAIHHRKADGRLAPKVFKGRVRTLAAGEVWTHEGRHKFRPITTRVYYSGRHLFEPRVNGQAFKSVPFDLKGV